MKTIIQVTSISGNVIENANYTVQLGIPPAENHEMSLNFNTSDIPIINYLKSNERRGILMDGNNDDGFTISIKCDIKGIKHMVDTDDSSSQTFILISPSNKVSEQILMYLTNPEMCNPAFLKSIKN